MSAELDPRVNFRPVIGKIMERYLLSGEQQEAIANTQATFLAIHTKGGGIHKSGDISTINSNAKELGVTPDDIEAARKAIDSRSVDRSVPLPLFGALAVLLGFVSQETNDALLLAQAAERITQASDKKIDEAIKDGLVKSDASNRMFARGYIDVELNPELQKAQAIQHLADIVIGYIAIKNDEGNSLHPKVTNAANALSYLGLHFYRSAATILESSLSASGAGAGTGTASSADKPPALADIDKITSRLQISIEAAIPAGIPTLRSSIEILAAGAGKIARQFEGTEIGAIINKRLEQARGAKIAVGIGK